MADWTCESCTFLNSSRRRRCEVCDARRACSPVEDTSGRLTKKRRGEDGDKSATPSASATPAVPAPLVLGSRSSRNALAQSMLGDDAPLLPSTPDEQTRQSGAANGGSAVRPSVSCAGAGVLFSSAVEPSLMPEPPQPVVQTAPCFATLFSFGNGKAVEVSKASVDAAKARLQLVSSDDDSDDHRPGTGSTKEQQRPRHPVMSAQASMSEPPVTTNNSNPLSFANGRGVAVSLSTASVSQAKARLGLESSDNDDDANSSIAEEGRRITGPAPSAPGRAPRIGCGLPSQQSTLPQPMSRPSSGASDFLTPARGTLGVRKAFTAPRATVVTRTLHSFAPPVHAAALRTDTKNALNVASGEVKKKLVKLAVDLNKLVGGVVAPHPASLSELPAHSFPTSSCSAPLLHLMGEPTTDVGNSQFRHALLELGAVPAGCSDAWVAHHAALVKHKLLRHALANRHTTRETHFTPLHVLVQLCYRYNTEYVDGARSVLRKLCEKDIAPGVAMVLCIHAVAPVAAAPHTICVDLCDGWYVATTALDVPLTQLFRDGVLAVGQKITVCGAASRYEPAAGPLEIPIGTTLLAVGRNGVAKAPDTAQLGQLSLAQIPVVPLRLLHPQGGTIAALEAVVTRVLPAYFVQTLPEEGRGDKKGPLSTSSSGAKQPRSSGARQPRIIRNAAAHSKFHEALERKREAAYEKATETMTRDEAADLMREQFPLDVSQVLTFIVEDGDNEVAAIQLWTEHVNCSSDEASALPREGSRVIFYSLKPSRYERCGPPLSCKLLHARRQLSFQPSIEPSSSLLPNGVKRRICSVLSDLGKPSDAPRHTLLPDLCVVCVGIKALDDHRSVLLVIGAEANIFGVIEIHSVPNERELLLPLPPEASACVVQCVRFLGSDDTQENTVFRFDASEYTSIVHRPRNADAAAAVAVLDRNRASWRPTYEAAKKILCDVDVLRRWISRGDHYLHTSVVEGSAPHVAPCVDSGSFRGPRYLMNPPSAQKGVSLARRSGVGGASPESSGRELFASSMTLSSSVADDAIAPAGPPPCMDITRHVFGNVLLDSAVFQVLDAASHQVISFFDLFAEEASNKAVILSAGEDPHPKAAGLLTACSYRLLLRINGGLDGVYVRTVAFAAGLLEAVMTAACGAVHSLLSVCVDEDHFLLSVDRGTVLSALPTEERKWIALFANSAVVPKCVLDETKARLLAEADGGHSADQIVDVGAVRLHHLDRWNRDLVAVEDVLWWSEAEWRMLQDMIVSGLRDKLFKLTLSDHKPQSVERCVFLRDKCPVAELFC